MGAAQKQSEPAAEPVLSPHFVERDEMVKVKAFVLNGKSSSHESVTESDEDTSATPPEKESEASPNTTPPSIEDIFYINGSGLAGKSQLLAWIRDKFSPKSQGEEAQGDEVKRLLVAHGQFVLETVDDVDLIDAWGKTLRSMREGIETAAKGGTWPKAEFPIFDAFYKRCVEARGGADRPYDGSMRILRFVLTSILVVLEILAFFSFEKVQNWISYILPSNLIVPQYVIQGATLLVMVATIMVFRWVDADKWNRLTISLRDKGFRRCLYSKFGENPLEYPERLSQEPNQHWPKSKSENGKDFNQEILIRAFNADLARWITKLPENGKLTLMLDVQQLPPADSPVQTGVRARVRSAVDTFLERDTQSTPAAARAPVVIASKYVNFGGRADTSRLIAAKDAKDAKGNGLALRIGFLTREKAWELVGKIMQAWVDEIPNNYEDADFWNAMLRARSVGLDDEGKLEISSPWTLNRKSNPDYDPASTEGNKSQKFRALTMPEKGEFNDYQRMILQIGFAFGPLAASLAVNSTKDMEDEESDDRLAGMIDRRMKNFRNRLFKLKGQFPNAATDDGFKSLIREWVGSGDNNRDLQSDLDRAFEQDDPIILEAARLLAPFKYGLRKLDLVRAGFDGTEIEALCESPKFTDTEERFALKSEDRQLILACGAHESDDCKVKRTQIHSAMLDECPGGKSIREDSPTNATYALTWLPLMAIDLPDLAEDDQLARLSALADRIFTLGGYKALDPEQNLELQHRLGECALRYLAKANYTLSSISGDEAGTSRRKYEQQRLQNIAERYMRRFAYGQFDPRVREAFVKLLRTRGKTAPVVRHLAKFLAEYGGESARGDKWEPIHLMHVEHCREEAFAELAAIAKNGTTSLPAEDRLEFLRLYRKVADSLASQCLPGKDRDGYWTVSKDGLTDSVARAEKRYLVPLFDHVSSAIEDLPEHAGEIGFLALRTASYWQQKLLRYNCLDSRTGQYVGDEHNADFLNNLIEPSRTRQAIVIGHLANKKALFIPRSRGEFNDLRSLLKSDQAIKGETPEQLDNWIYASLEAFFGNATASLSGAGSHEDSWSRGMKCFADAAFPLAIALRIDWNWTDRKNNRIYLEAEKAQLGPSINALRSAYCDFVTRRFARESRLLGGDGQGDADLARIMSGDAYKKARESFAETDFFLSCEDAPVSESDRIEDMVCALLNAVSLASPERVADNRAGALLVADKFAKIRGTLPGGNDENDLILCQVKNCETIAVLGSNLVPTKRWTSGWKDWEVTQPPAQFNWQEGPPVLLNLLAPHQGTPVKYGSSRNLCEETFRTATAKGDGGDKKSGFVSNVINTFAPILTPEEVALRFIKMGGSNSIAAVSVSQTQSEALSAGGGILSKMLCRLASLNRLILIDWEGPPVTGDDQSLERRANRFLLRTMEMGWWVEGDKADPDPEKYGEWQKVPAFVSRFNEDSGTFELLTLHHNPARPGDDPSKLRTVHGLFPKVMIDRYPQYQFDHVETLSRRVCEETD